MEYRDIYFDMGYRPDKFYLFFEHKNQICIFGKLVVKKWNIVYILSIL